MSSALLDGMLRVAKLAGALVSEQRTQQAVQVRYKSPRDLVTSTDLAAEKLILEHLRELDPQARILAEESAPHVNPQELQHGRWWIVDPIDGTNNYARGHVHVAVSIAYADSGVVAAGVVEAPFLSETYHALRNCGAYLNQQPIRVRPCDSLEQALIATGFPYERADTRGLSARVMRLLSACQDIRRAGACALDLAWLAAGRLDGYYETVNPWDMAAGALWCARPEG